MIRLRIIKSFLSKHVLRSANVFVEFGIMYWYSVKKTQALSFADSTSQTMSSIGKDCRCCWVFVSDHLRALTIASKSSTVEVTVKEVRGFCALGYRPATGSQ